jgi:serine/arginine repetitive matrix protein 2
VSSMTPVDSNGPVDSKAEQGAADSGPALEVIQLANGETIWSVFIVRTLLYCRSNTLSRSIVNGLRDADDESLYTSRASFASEYSTREPGSDGGSIFTKEHSRTGSKGSAVSFASKKKPQQGKVRPETKVCSSNFVFHLLLMSECKVFHSSSAQIGRLIESLSQGVDSGSFNILPNTNRGPGHSASSSLSTNDINWTVEERLDRMLGAINNNNS